MHYNYNNDKLAVGFIKELLRDFNLPTVKVVTPNTIPYNGQLYLNEGYISRYENNQFNKLYKYNYGDSILNFTKNFTIRSTTYDDATHKYLGDYLRFLRDYKHLDLMQLYNCFGNVQPSKIVDVHDMKEYQHLDINTESKVDKYYIIPIKFNSQYTIAIDSFFSYEISCILYGNNYIENTPLELRRDSFVEINGSRFNKPFTYDTYLFEGKDQKYITYCMDHEKDLYMLLKVPKGLTTSIVILEGNYVSDSNVIDNRLFTKQIISDGDLEPQEWDSEGKPTKKNRKYVDRYDTEHLLTKDSLIWYNSNTSYPFSDRLIEYLIGNTIDNLDRISDNVKRTQEYVGVINSGLWDNDTRLGVNKKSMITLRNQKTNDIVISKTNSHTYYDSEGKRFNFVYVDNMKEKKKLDRRYIDEHNDLLGYVDSDSEVFIKR